MNNYFFQLSSTAVFKNLAKGKPAWQSSENGNALNAVDGKRLANLASCSHSNYEHSPWLTVDLESMYKIIEVVITNRGDCCCEHHFQFNKKSSLPCLIGIIADSFTVSFVIERGGGGRSWENALAHL